MKDGGWSDWSVGVLGLALNKSAMLTGYATIERRPAETPTPIYAARFP